MTSYFAGLSLREIYEKKCVELHCRKNSIICQLLSDVPDEYQSLTVIDLSKNFLGPKGILPLLEIIRCCRNIHTLDFRGQQLNCEAIDVFCLALKQHPSVVRVNLSDNPLTMAAGIALLQLVKVNTMLEEMLVENTGIRKSLLDAMQAQLGKNKMLKEKLAELELALPQLYEGKSNNSSRSSSTRPQSRSRGSRISPVQMVRAAAVVASSGNAKSNNSNNSNSMDYTIELTNTAVLLGDNTERKRLKSEDVDVLLLSFTHSVHEMLFDENPIPVIAQLCEQQYAWFYDNQFAADGMAVQHRATQRYDITGWRRIVDLYPGAKLFPDNEEETRLVLPKETPLFFSWIFVCVDAVFTDMESLRTCLLFSPVMGHGVYALRVHIDGAWRFVIVDDLLPVNNKDELIFTKPVNGKYFWPCILEKALAKLHGSYTSLEYSMQEDFRARISSRAERGRFLTTQRAYSVFSLEGVNNNNLLSNTTNNNTYNTLQNNERRTNCAKTLSDLSGGVGIVRFLNHEHFQSEEWWLTMLDVHSAGALVVAVSAPAHKTIAGIEPSHAYRILQVRQLNGVRLLELCSPWAAAQWRGDWWEESPLWSRHKDVDIALRSQQRNVKKHTSSSSFSSPFWISYTDFIMGFIQVHLCHLFQGFHQRIIHDEWDRNSAGGSCYERTWDINPHYRLKITQDSPYFINLSLPDRRFTPADIESLGLHIIKSRQYPVHCFHDNQCVVGNTKYVMTDSLSFESIIRAGDNYWIVPSSFVNGIMGKFILRVFFQSSFIIWKEDISYHWNTYYYEDYVKCSGDYRTCDDNVQILLSFHSHNTMYGNYNNNDHNKTGTVIIKARVLPEDDKDDDHGGKNGNDDNSNENKNDENNNNNNNNNNNSELALGMFLVRTNIINDKPARSIGVIKDELMIASTPFMLNEPVFLEKEVSSGEKYTLIVCIHPVGSKGKLEFTIWSSLPIPRLMSLPIWSKKNVVVSWPQGSGSYYEVTKNPQVEIYPAKMLEIFVIQMHVKDCSYADPFIVFFVLGNDCRQGEGIKGQIPADRVIMRSQYVRHHTVQCEVVITESMDSVLVIPCLQPAGSMGECTISVSSESGDFMLRALSTL